MNSFCGARSCRVRAERTAMNRILVLVLALLTFVALPAFADGGYGGSRDETFLGWLIFFIVFVALLIAFMRRIRRGDE